MSMAARSNMSDEQGVLTINLASNFVDVAAGECIKVCASTIKMTATMAFIEAKLYSDSRLCATGSATFKIFKHRVIS
jgi:acyl-coenzyme A thioesterase PaaI-like protein